MVSFGERLRSEREKKQLSQEELGQFIKVAKSTISQYELGKRKPDTDTLQQFANIFNVSTDYLLGRSDNSKISTALNSIRNTTIPVLGTIRAGIPILAEDNWDEEIEVPSYVEADFALRVAGDSMSWSGISEGDLALMEQISVARHGEIVAAGVEDGEWRATLKFFVQENGGFYLRAANPEYEDIEFTNQHRIIGRLIRIIKEPPTLHDYKQMAVSKEIHDQDWNDAILTAEEHGLGGKKVKDMVGLFADVVKKVK